MNEELILYYNLLNYEMSKNITMVSYFVRHVIKIMFESMMLFLV